MEKMLNLVLFGPPGAGKGTQSEKLIDKYNLVHLSTGDILRSEIASGTDLGRKAREVMDRGELVSDEIVIGMIESRLDENSAAKGFIFDGFPRTAAQAVALDDLLQKKGTGISAMLALEVEDEELVKRLLNRGKDSGRPDDRDESTIRRRIQEYNNKTLPLKKYYNEQGKFHSIHGIGSIEDIFQALVDRITFLKAEMDLTALETDIEHLDLTISDFEEANDIAPELLLEIDAIKRAEAEEEDERKELEKQKKKKAAVKSKKPSGKIKNILKKVVNKVLGKSGKKATKKTAVKKTAPKKASPKKVVAAKKAAGGKKHNFFKKPLGPKVAQKIAAKKVTKKAAAKKKVVPKKPLKKSLVRKLVKKKKQTGKK